jgi:flagellar motor switch protein FliM
MDKTLSQDEVDALLQAIKSGEPSGDEEKVRQTADEVKVVTYNFRKPHLISSDQLRGFQMIHESFAKSLQSSLLANLKTPLEVKPTAIDNLTYGEFVLSLLSPTFLAVLSTSPDMGELVLEINISVILGMVDILLGGDGGSTYEARELTAIEQSIAGAILDHFLTELKVAWEDTVNITFKVQAIESNPEYVQIVSSESSILSATFDLRMGETTGTLNICYPFEMIQPILGRVTARMSGRRERASGPGNNREEVLAALGAVPLGIRAEIGRSVLLASQVGRLKLGDVLCLDKRADEPVDVFLGDRFCYAAELGLNRGKVAVRLLRRSPENKNESDGVQGVGVKK